MAITDHTGIPPLILNACVKRVNISASDNPFCLGSSVTLTPTIECIETAQITSYAWVLNGEIVDTTVDPYTSTAFADGDTIYFIVGVGATYYYSNLIHWAVKTDGCITVIQYGLLYNWYAATDVRKITSSDDWRIPISAIGYNYIGDIPDLVEHLSTIPVSCNTNDAAKFLKTTGTEFWTIGTGLNSVGFNAKGTGRRTELGEFSALKVQYLFWSTSAIFDTSTNKSAVLIGDSDDQVIYTRFMCGGQIYNTNNGLSVRLIRNATAPEQLLTDGTACEHYVGNDLKIYRTVKIGTQVWTASNLAETKFRNGNYLHGYEGGSYQAISNAAWAALTTEGVCAYNNDINLI